MPLFSPTQLEAKGKCSLPPPYAAHLRHADRLAPPPPEPLPRAPPLLSHHPPLPLCDFSPPLRCGALYPPLPPPPRQPQAILRRQRREAAPLRGGRSRGGGGGGGGGGGRAAAAVPGRSDWAGWICV